MHSNKHNSFIFICDKGKAHFAISILKYLKTKCKIYYSETKYDFLHGIRSKNKKIIWVEWARKQAKYISNNIKSNQKLFIRLHRFEMEDIITLKKIKWANVETVIFVCSDLQKEFSNLFPDVNTIMIPNSIDISLFKLNLIDEKNSLLAFGTEFDPRKGYHKLIKLFSKVVKNDPSFSLTIAGQEPKKNITNNYFNHCQKLILKYDLQEHCYLQKLIISNNELNNQLNAIKLLRHHNAILSYSESESFHYSFAEGLLAGLQGFCNGWRELNPYEFWGDYCYVNEKEFLNGLLEWGKLSVKNRNKIALKNRQYIINNFSNKVIGEKFNNLFFS